MVCQAMNSWTFCELVAAFLDLSIAYLLLCASSLAFLASKFLGLFGLCLPCPCDGLFWKPRNNQCLQGQLVDCPYEKISSVMFSAKSKFPFDPIWAEDQIGNTGLKFGNEGNLQNGHVEFECAASSGSFTERRLGDLAERHSVNKPGVEFGAGNLAGSNEEQYDLKGKRVVGRRLRHGLRRRRRGASVSFGKLSSFSSYDTLQSDAQYTPQSLSSISKMANEVTEDTNNYGVLDDREAPKDFGSTDKVSLGLELNDSKDGNNHLQREEVSIEELGCDAPRDLNFDKNEKNMIRVLEQALEEEHAARSALYLELEKERSAAATAADEAMAMILRLQEEKASIEMEARQYQRMIEAKAAYDAEEMNIFKEILLRREREKHFLEKEVEAYRQMILENDQSYSDVPEAPAILQQDSSTLYSKQDPLLMLEQINESIQKPKSEIVISSLDYELPSFNSQNHTLAFGKHLEIPQMAEDDSLKEIDMHGHPSIDTHSHFLNSTRTNLEFPEKGTMDENLFSQQREVERLEACSKGNELITPQGLNLHEKSITPVVEGPDPTGSSSVCVDFTSKASDIPYPESKDPPNVVLDAESCVYDVHVIDDESKVLNEMSAEKSEHQSVSAPLKVLRKWGSTSMSMSGTRYDMNRSSSDISSGLPPRGYSREKTAPTDLRRNSMSAVDYERLKIENEVEWLRERLRIVQEGREKLNFSVGHREREKLQLQLLEDIAGQLREIRQLNEPGKAERQASFPPAYSKVTSKKRRWRSSSIGVYRST
ncbi:Zein-binding domain containing protein [Parasponia andersonii]|uniref:Zein-binding domain containing protein n=1 Tax=Parasponia andersonii TaxID=3476 RepID=A0A2P5CRW6_PARAD|nr:Zein-binding domain containing protein [Parasponia andersonii]